MFCVSKAKTVEHNIGMGTNNHFFFKLPMLLLRKLYNFKQE